MTGRVSAFLLTALMLILPAPAAAQSLVPPPPPPKEPIALGGVLGVGFPAQLVSIRLSLPLRRALGLDLDAGRIHGLGDDGQVAGGGGYSARLRWLWHGRSATGHSGYWLAGPLYLQATNRMAGVLLDRHPITTVQVGYGWDWISRSGNRTGVELSSGGGQGPVFLINVFFQRVLSR